LPKSETRRIARRFIPGARLLATPTLDPQTLAGAFSDAECDALIAAVTEAGARDAGLVGQGTNHNIRRAEITWLDDVPGTDWVMDRVIDMVREANRGFGFDLTEFAESPQVARYGAERGGHFDWHTDIGDGPVARRRKLTIVAQLSAPEAYEGGALELLPDARARQADRARGTATIFPSFVLHRVTPVTRGERHSLTLWAHGPAFR
jgi:PKHD-type hydroxylase